MRRSHLLALTMMLGLAATPFPQPSASASCAAPYLTGTGHLVLQRGTRVTIEGRGFTEGGCQDSISCTRSLGCQSCAYDDPPAVPMKAVTLQLVQHDRSWDLATVDAGSAVNDHLGRVSWTFDLPRGVQPGRARLAAEHASPVWIRIRGVTSAHR